MRSFLCICSFTVLVLSPFLAAGHGLFYSQDEVQIWRERAGMVRGAPSMYRFSGDVSPNSPADYSRVFLAGLTFLANAEADRYTNHYGGDSCYPTSQKHGWDDADVMAFQPDRAGDWMKAAAFLYLLNGDEAFAEKVREEILWHIGIPQLDARNNLYFCTDPMTNTGDFNNFFLAMWYQKLLFAYDMTSASPAWNDGDHAELQAWFLAAARYFQTMYEEDFNRSFPGRLDGDYTGYTDSSYDENGWQTAHGCYQCGRVLFDGGPGIYNLSRLYNNRRLAQMSFAFTVGVYFDDEAIIASGKRFFKETLAYGLLAYEGELFHSDMHRGSPGNSYEVGYHYSLAAAHSLIGMADVYARFRSNELYEYTLDGADFAMFFPEAFVTRPWYKDLAVPGKSLYRFLRTCAKLTSRQLPYATLGGFPLDGMSVHLGSLVRRAYDVWLTQANLFYRDTMIQEVYTRNYPGMTDYFPSWRQDSGTFEGQSYDAVHVLGPGIYGNLPWGGLHNLYPAMLLQWGQIEGQAWPFQTPWAQTDARLGEGWADSWLGTLYDASYPHVFHLRHGWWWIQPIDRTAAKAACWIYDASLGWLYSEARYYPIIYSGSHARWFMLDGQQPDRRLYDFSEEAWILESELDG